MSRREKLLMIVAFISTATLVIHLGVTVYSQNREARLFAHDCQTSPTKRVN